MSTHTSLINVCLGLIKNVALEGKGMHVTCSLQMTVHVKYIFNIVKYPLNIL